MILPLSPRKVWEHPNPKSTAMWEFMQLSNQRYGLDMRTFPDLYEWSITQRCDFWGLLWETQNYIHEGSYTQVVDESIPLSQLPRWFEGVRVNWAENILWTRDAGAPAGSRSVAVKQDDLVAVTEIREGNTEIREATWGELRRRAGELAGALAAHGVGTGDRVVLVGSHSIQTLLVFLATTWVGGVFSSSSTDMGVSGILQRSSQIDPKFVFFDDGALYNGKVIDLRDKIRDVVDGMKKCPSFQNAIVIQRFDTPYDTSHIMRTKRLEDFLRSSPSKPPPIARVGFQDPFVVYYSSGTTGIPKAIVHAVGPLLLNHGKEMKLHRGLENMNVGLQFTTTGWIMYMAAIGQLLFGGRSVLYDGSPFMPDMSVLLRITAEQRVNSLGISPRWLGELMKAGIVPKRVFDLSSLKFVGSTGMVLKEQLFEWFYDVAFPPSVRLGNFSGGTDIAGCFALDNPLTPIYAGGCQGGSLGTPMAIFPALSADGDPENPPVGHPIPDGEPGDLIGTAAFPNVPIYLWGDTKPAPGAKYRSTYLGRFRGVWSQGDFAAIHPQTRSLYILGRSDGVLNPSGIRFGSADIYAVLEKWFPTEVVESLCVGQRRPEDADEQVVLFVLLRPGFGLREKDLEARIRQKIAAELTKRHVPKYIFEAPEIPVTVNGKKVELPVKQIVSGKTIKPSGTLLNPQSLDFFYQFQKVEEIVERMEKDKKAKL